MWVRDEVVARHLFYVDLSDMQNFPYYLVAQLPRVIAWGRVKIKDKYHACRVFRGCRNSRWSCEKLDHSGRLFKRNLTKVAILGDQLTFASGLF